MVVLQKFEKGTCKRSRVGGGGGGVLIGIRRYTCTAKATGAKYEQVLNYFIVLSPVRYRMLKYTSFANTTTDIYNVASIHFDH